MNLEAELHEFMGHDPGVMAGAGPYILEAGRTDGAGSLILLHGWGASPQSMRLVAERVAQSGVRTVVPLLSGHATAPADLESVTAVDWIEQISGIVTGLAAAGPVSIAGCSLGAALSLATAGIHPDLIRTATGINGGLTLLRPDFVASAMLEPAGVALCADEFGSMTMDPDSVELGYGQVALPRASFLQAMALMTLVREVAPRIVAPTLLLHSRQDRVIPFVNAERLRALLTAAPVSIMPLENSFHAAQVDYDAPVIADALIEHLQDGGHTREPGHRAG